MTPPARPVVIAGGGTAGHILPGLSIAAALVARGVDRSRLVWVGSRRGQDAALVAPEGIELLVLPGRGIQRGLAPRQVIDNVGAVVGLGVALARALWWVARRRPAVVVSLGGYASVAASLAAVVWRVPLVVTEQNAVAGAANRWLGRFAAASAVPFDGSDLPRATVTGNPVRAAFLRRRRATADVDRAARSEARRELGVEPDRILVAAFAGSLGSRRINEAVVGLAERWASRADVAVHHVVGRRDWSSFVGPDVGDGGLSYTAVEYEDRMDALLAAADVAVCRSGGSTVAELAVVGVGAVMVPLPIAPGDHQRHNAMALVREGGGVVLDDAGCTPEGLDALLAPLCDDRGRLDEMAAAAWRLGRPDAADAAAALIESVMAGGAVAGARR